jgi:hypothetical protein
MNISSNEHRHERILNNSALSHVETDSNHSKWSEAITYWLGDNWIVCSYVNGVISAFQYSVCFQYENHHTVLSTFLTCKCEIFCPVGASK